VTDARWWTAADVRAATADPSWPDSLADVPAAVVDLRDDADDVAPPPLHRAPCPVIAMVPADGETDWPVDLALADGSDDVAVLGAGVEDAVHVLVDRAAANPTAAATLARVLRVTAELDVADALEVESLAYSMLLAGPEFRRWLDQRSAPRPKGDGEAEVVRTERSGGVLHVTLNRPQVHNAFSAAMRDALIEALGVAEVDWSVGTVELAGAGPTFCSGGDLAEFGTADDPVHAHLVRTGRSVGAVMHRVRDRLTVRVHGACTGAGVELPAFARRVVAVEDTTFRLPEVGMGLIPGAGGTVSLPRRIGPARTLLLALSGVALPVDTARRWGLVDTLSPNEDEGQD
jgi:enoyl-CoA hydratase/carnithine racemase